MRKAKIERYTRAGYELGRLVQRKNAAYGDSAGRVAEFLELLFPEGIPKSKYRDAILLGRIFDKQMRVARRKRAFGESPYLDIAGYGLIGFAGERKRRKK